MRIKKISKQELQQQEQEQHQQQQQLRYEQELQAIGNDDSLPSTPIPSPPPTPPASVSPPPPPPPLYAASVEPITTIPMIPVMPTSTLALGSSAINSLSDTVLLTDTSTTDEEDISQITPLPMPILPPLKTDLLQMLPTKPLVDDDEG